MARRAGSPSATAPWKIARSPSPPAQPMSTMPASRVLSERAQSAAISTATIPHDTSKAVGVSSMGSESRSGM